MTSADAVELGRSGGCNLERGDGPGDFSVGAVEAVRLLEGAARPGQCGIGSAQADGYFGRFAGSAVHGDGVVLLDLPLHLSLYILLISLLLVYPCYLKTVFFLLVHPLKIQ